MMAWARIALSTVVGLIWSAMASAQAAPAPEGKYLSIHFQVHGLEQSAALISEALATLAERIEAIGENSSDLSPEEVEQLIALTASTRDLLESVQRTLQDVGPAIARAREPTREVLIDLLTTVRSTAIDPALERIDASVRSWLIISLFGVAVLLAAAGWTLLATLRQLKAVSHALERIAGDYQVVPKSLLERTAVPTPPSPAGGSH